MPFRVLRVVDAHGKLLGVEIDLQHGQFMRVRDGEQRVIFSPGIFVEEGAARQAIFDSQDDPGDD